MPVGRSANAALERVQTNYAPSFGDYRRAVRAAVELV